MNDELKMTFLILNYLNKNPRAKDTIEGISKWWLLKEHIDYSVDNIKNVIDLLVSNGFLIVDMKKNQKRVYQVNQEKLDEIKETINIIYKQLNYEKIVFN